MAAIQCNIRDIRGGARAGERRHQRVMFSVAPPSVALTSKGKMREAVGEKNMKSCTLFKDAHWIYIAIADQPEQQAGTLFQNKTY